MENKSNCENKVFSLRRSPEPTPILINDVAVAWNPSDHAGSARAAGAILDVMKDAEKKHSVVNSVLEILKKVEPTDFQDVKLFASVLKKVVTKAVPELDNGLDGKGAKLMGGMMASLAKRLMIEVKQEDRKGSSIMAGEINNITKTMLNSSDVIINSKDESIFNTSQDSLSMFSTHQQYREGTESMVKGLAYSGVAIITNLLPHEEETVLNTNETQLWLKVESPDSLANLSGIPANQTTMVKMSSELANNLKSSSKDIAVEVMTFKNNPYWWDIQDRDVASEIASVRAWKRSPEKLKAIKEIADPVDIYLDVKNMKFEVLSGLVTMANPSDNDDEKDASIMVHTLEAPEEDSNGKVFVEFQNLTEDSLLKATITTNFRPDYMLMANESIPVNSTSPIISLLYNNISTSTLHFIGIYIPPSNATTVKSVQYSMKVYSVQCKVRQQTLWTSPACKVGEQTTKDTIHCRCSHLSVFGSSIFVAPNTVHPIKDLYLFMNLSSNPLVFSLVTALLMLYIILMIWARLQEKQDKLKRKVIVLDDNYPGDEYPYLVAVYTAYNIGAATEANVGMELIGEKISSRDDRRGRWAWIYFLRNDMNPVLLRRCRQVQNAHNMHRIESQIFGATGFLLRHSKEKKKNLGGKRSMASKICDCSVDMTHILRSNERKVFRRNADDWFLLFTPVHLGKLEAVHIWHDNTSSHPDWYCQKFKVYDITDEEEYTFLVNQWLSIWPGEHIEALTKSAKPVDEYDWRNVVVHNIVYNFQEKHLWFSIFVCHPRATLTKSQRLTIAFCSIMVTFLFGIMFYGVAKGQVTEDEPGYSIKIREIKIAIQCAILSAIVTSFVVTCFKRSQVIVPCRSSVQRKDVNPANKNQPNQKTPAHWKKGAIIVKFFYNSLHEMVKSKPLMPVLFGKESSESVVRRRRYARIGWLMSQIIIWGSGFFIVLYGLKLGKVISELWVTTSAFCFMNGIFLSAPLKILALSTALAFFGEMYDVTTYECEVESAKKKGNFGDEGYLSKLLELRSSAIYHPLSAAKTQELKEQAEKLTKKLKFTEFVITVLFFLSIMNYTAYLRQNNGFFINSHIETRLTNSLSSRSVGLEEVLNVYRLTDYLIVNLIPNLYKEKWYNKARLTSPDESLEDMGWLSDATHRLVGVPQLRQIRVKAVNCTCGKVFNISSNIKSLPSLSPVTEDTKNHGLHWGPINKYVNKPLLSPFTYQADSGDGSLMYGDSGVAYHGGGYTVMLEDTQRECNVVVADLIDNGWWNIQARAFIAEMSIFNPNTGSHSLITIITEHLASGAFRNRIQVTTVSLSFQYFNFGLFLLILLIFNFRLVISINRHGFFSTFAHFWRLYELVFVTLCNLTAVFESLKILRAATLVHIFQQVADSNFFYFSNIVFYQRFSLSLWCILLISAPIRIMKFKFLLYTCKAACYTLYKSRKPLIAMAFLVILMFSIQIFIINKTIPPQTITFAFDSKYFSMRPHEDFITEDSFSSKMKSIWIAFRWDSVVVIMRMILIVIYKVMSDY